jgi:hypothetical protein
MIEITKLLQSHPNSYMYTHLELADEMAKQEKLQDYRPRLLEYRQRLDGI